MTLLPAKSAPNQSRLIVIPESALELGEELGSGAFGIVYKVFITISQTQCHIITTVHILHKCLMVQNFDKWSNQ